MSIIGHGIDLVDVARIQEMVDRHGERFLTRCFTPDELAYADTNIKRRMEHLAARFAAKEAVLKAVGTGWRHGIAWTDAEVTRLPSGAPGVRVHGKLNEIADELGIKKWFISMTHTETQAMASVIAEGE